MTLARIFDSRKDIAMRDGNVGIALVVLEVDIEIRVLLFDEIALQNKRFMFTLDHHVIK